MKVSRQFRNDFETVLAHYGATDQDRRDIEATITPENLADWEVCLRDVAARVNPPSIEAQINARWDEERRLNPPPPREIPPLALDSAPKKGVSSGRRRQQPVSNVRYRQ